MKKTEMVKIYFPIGALAFSSAFFLYDIVVDISKGIESNTHLALEGLVFFTITAVLFYEILRIIQLGKELKKEKGKVARLSGDLGKVIIKNFEEWGLTETEKEVALLLIKGLSMIEIGRIRGVKEKTIRQQATSIYSKSNCTNRHDLAAIFIEDLLNIE